MSFARPATQDTVSARAVLSALAQRDPTNAALLSGMGRLYLQLGDVAQAETVFQRVEAVAGGTDPDLVLLNR